MLRIKWRNQAEYAREVEQFIGRVLVATKRAMSEVADEIIKDANDNLRKSLMLGASPPQFMRKSAPEWIHTPIEDAWSYAIEIKGDYATLRVENNSEHAAAVEFGTIPAEPIRPKQRPYLVFDSLYFGVVKKRQVSGQAKKAFLAQTLSDWRDKFPVEVKRRIAAYL